MTADLASLVLAVDSRQVKEGEVALDKLTAAGKRTEDQTKQTAASVDVLTRLYRDLGVAAATYKVLDMAKEAAMLNARYQELGVVQAVVGKNAGYTAQQMEQAAISMQKLGISMLESRNTTVQLAQAQISLADAGRLARVAQDTAVIGNINSSEALQRMVYGIKSGQIEVLRTIGINVNFEQSYKKLADELHKTTAALSEKEKMHARENAVLEEGAKLNGAYEAAMGIAGKQIRSMTRYMEDLKVMRGEVFNEALTVGVMAFVEQLKEANQETRNLSQNGNLKQWGTDVADTLAFVADSLLSVKALIGIVSHGIGAVAAKAAIKWDIALSADERRRMQANIDAEYDAYVDGQLNLTHALRDSLAARRAAQAKDTADRLALDAEYAKKALIIQKAYAGYSIEIQRAAQLSLAQALYPHGFPTAPKEESAALSPKGTDKVKEFVAALEKEAAALGRSTVEKKLNEAAQLKLTSATMAHVKALLLEMSQYQLAEDKAKDRADKRNKEYEDILKFQEAEVLRSYTAVNAADKAVAQAQREYNQFGLLKSTILELGLVEMERRAKNLTEGTVAYDNLQREIEAQRKLIEIATKTEARDAGIKAAKDAADAWKRASDQVQQSLTDALMNGFNSGKGFAKAFVDNVKAMFNTLVLRPVISAIVSPVAGAVTSALGFSGAANAASGAGALGNVGSLAGLAGSAGAFGSGLGAGVGSLLGEAGIMGGLDAGLIAMQAGNIAGGLGTLAGVLGPIALGIGAVYALAKNLDHSGTPHTGAGTSYSAAGGLQQASSGALFNSGFTGIAYSAGTEEFTTGIVKSVVQILDTTATTFGKTAGYQAAASFADDSSKDGAWGSLFIRNLQGIITDWQAGGQSFRTFSDGTAGNNEYLAAISSDVRAAIEGIDLPDWADKMLGKLGDAPSLDQLANVVSEINATQVVLQSLGASVKVFAGLSGDAVLNIISASGGLQSFSASLGAYYENFYSEQEKFDAKLQGLTTRLQDLAAGGAFADSSEQFFKAITEPTRANFRKLIEAQDLTTTSGQATYAALLSLSGVVAELTPVAEAAADAVQTLGTVALTLADVQKLFDSQAKTILNTAEYSAYRIQQIQATLSAAGMDLSAAQITHATREQVLAGYQQALAAGNLAAASAILNVVDALTEVSAGFQGVTTESTSAAAAVQKVVTTLADVQTQFGSAARTLLNDVQYTAYQVAQIQATLGSVGINVTAADIQNATREQVLAGLSEMMAAGNLDAARAILSVVGALSEVSSGFQTVAATASNAAAVMQQRAGLESTLLNLTGNTAAIRERELAALDASNRGLQQHIYAIQDAQQAVQDAQQAVSAATSAYQAQESAISSLQSAAQRWIGTMSTATSLLDQISGALGGTGGNREAALWATVNGAGDIDARLSAAQELFSVITQTAATEQAAQDNALSNAKALLEYGQRLRDYVQGLKTGDLSTLTPAQKVAEALAQYQTTLAAAQGGDQTALGNLQGVADTYLRLAREFDPASYTASVFTSVTSALDSLGAGLISQNQPQVDLLQSQLDATNAASASANSLSADQIARLTTLQGVVQDLQAQAATQSAIANAQVSSAQANLQSLGAAQLAAQQALAVQQQAVVTAQQAATAYMATLADVAVTDPVPDILRSLPEGIAAALAPLINANPASTAAATAATTAQRAQIIRDYAATLPQDDTGARMLYDAAVANGVSSAELDAAMGFAAGSSLAWAVSHGLPAFAQGTNYVPADMVAQIHKGEAIVPARYNPANGGNAALEAKLEAVLAELKSLREQNNAGHLMGAQATHENTKQITHATERGASQLAHTQRLQQRAVVA